jgi:diacylglycerol kinase family enzyme
VVRLRRDRDPLSTVPGVVFVNPGAGPDDTDLADLRSRFAGHEVTTVDPADLGSHVRSALPTEPSFIGVAGGDGTIRTVAAQLSGGPTPLLVVPEGTRNHFAHDVGIDSLGDAAAAASSQRTVTIDLGEVNGEVFVNNSSLGLYPKIVVRREAHERRFRKGVATVVATLEQLRAAHPMTVDVDGEVHRAWMVFVGNGLYGEGLLDLADRERMDTGTLDVRVVRADRRLARLRIVGALLLGRLGRSPLVVRQQVSAMTISVDRGDVEVALDGEVVRMRSPLAYRSVPASLLVKLPPDDG